MALYVGDNEISQKILLKGNVGVQLPTMSSDTEGQYLSNDGIQPVWKDEQVGYKQITNCITEIPQDIKLELNDGTLTLKAGSKLYVPNGVGVFDAVTIESDRTITRNIDGSYFVTANNSDGLNITAAGNVSSGTNPTPTTYNLQYNTTDNKIRRYGSSTDSYTEDSLPVAKVTVSNSAISSIDQVFNGFGYIGSTVFALPDVKGLIPNGRNADGSLKSVEFILPSVIVSTLTGSNRTMVAISQTAGKNYFLYRGTNSICKYDEAKNINIDTSKNEQWNVLVVGSTTGDITSLEVKQPLHAVDRNDSSWIAQQAMPSDKYIDLTLGVSGAKYTAPANGWFSIACMGRQVRLWNSYVGNSGGETSNDIAQMVSIPATKGQTVTLQYASCSISSNWSYFRFVYAEGE